MSEWKYSKIPKVAFTYWSGRMSYLHYCTLKSFRELNPDWKIVLYCPTYAYEGNNTWSSWEHTVKYTKKDYTEDALKLNIDIIKIDLVDIGFRNDVPEVFKSNYVTYYILSKFGGVWFDMDILFIKPMNELNLTGNIIKGDFDSIEVVISYAEGLFSTGLLISAPESKFFKLLFDELLKNFNPQVYQSATNNLYPRLFGDLNGIIQKFPDLYFANLSMDIVYPYKWYEMHILFTQNDINKITDKKTIGIHWYNGHPVTETFLNSENYGAELTINTIIKKYLNYVY